jgi:hypothetical protein
VYLPDGSVAPIITPALFISLSPSSSCGAIYEMSSNYLDVTQLRLPSGLIMWLPLKVYRGRIRRSNEALVPHFVYSGDMDDTDRLQRWVLNIMRSKI